MDGVSARCDSDAADPQVVDLEQVEVATQRDRPGKLALQYWFFYYFNDFANVHEGDWEMAQLVFHADTPEQALAHPTWAMGPVVTTNSATLMNKGLELIEAHLLFGIPFERIDTVVHPQSIVHSMVEFTDAAVIAQLSMPDMRLPIAYAIGFPGRGEVPYGRIDWTSLSRLDFQAPDRKTFRCLDLAYQAGRIGGTAPAWLSAANEVAVEAFLDGTLGFLAIPRVIRNVMDRHRLEPVTSVEVVRTVDAWARAQARTAVEALKLKS